MSLSPRSLSRGHVILTAGLVLWLAAACARSEAPPTPTPPTPIPAARVLDASASVLPDNGLIVEVRVTLDRESKVFVEYENPIVGAFRTRPTETAAKEHVVHVARLRALTPYDYTVFLIGDEGAEVEGATGQFLTRRVPEALERLDFTVEGRPTPELVLFDLQDNPDSYYVVIDQDASIVWYYRNENTDPDQPTSIRSIRQKPNYNLVFWEGGPTGRRFNCCLKEITPLGELVDRLVNNEVDKFVHHDQIILPDDKVLYIANEIIEIRDLVDGVETTTRVLVESLREWDQTNHTTQEVWHSLDHYSTDTRGRWRGDPVSWLHANSLQIGPRGNYIISLRSLSQVISVSPNGKSIEWKLGGPESTYTFDDPSDTFYGQHTATELPNGNILIFDNGGSRPEEEGGEYSRALELTLNTYELNAVKVWEYRHDPDLFASSRSSAYRLENGNTLINFETNDDDPPRTIVEVAPNGSEVWKLQLRSESIRNSYRAYAHESIMGETRVR